MSSVTVLKDDNHASEGVLTHEEKGNTTGLESLSAQRRKLADISNLQDNAKQNMLLASKEYAEKLQKENITLMKALAHRNKIIELSSIEFQKLRINFQNVQEKNSQLAQAHSQMLAELNTNRDRLKAFQHELGCKNALLMARKIQLEVPANTSDGDCKSSQAHDKDTKRKPSVKPSGKSNVKPSNVNEKANSKRRVSGVTETTGVPEKTCQTEDDTEKGVVSREANQIVDNVINEKSVKDSLLSKRQCARRKSTRFDVQETEQTEKLFEMNEAIEITRPVLRRQSARLRPEEAEPCKSFNERGEVREKIKRRRVTSRLDFKEPEVTETLKADDAGFVETNLVSKESIGSRSEVVELSQSKHDTKEPNEKHRVSTRRRQSQTSAETDEAIKQVVKKPCLISSSVSEEEGHETESRDNNLKADETLKAGDAGSFVTKDSIGSRSEVVEQSESKPNGKRRVSTKRRQSETDEAIKVVKKPSLIPSLVSEEEGHEIESKHDELSRRLSVRRPSRVAAEKVQSYREVSLKVKMRRGQ